MLTPKLLTLQPQDLVGIFRWLNDEEAVDVLYLQVQCHPGAPLSRFLRLQRPLIDTETICRSVLQRAGNSLQIHACMARTQLRVPR